MTEKATDLTVPATQNVEQTVLNKEDEGTMEQLLTQTYADFFNT